jgi:hypothetical protein
LGGAGTGMSRGMDKVDWMDEMDMEKVEFILL